MSDYKEFEHKMTKTCESLNAQLATIRAGRANAAVLDQITVDYYGVPTPIQQVASVAAPDPRSLAITPWDQSVLKGIEKAILASAAKTRRVVCAEEHMIAGGLGEAVAGLRASKGTPAQMRFVAVNDVFGQSGTPAELLKAYGLDAAHIAEAATSF